MSSNSGFQFTIKLQWKYFYILFSSASNYPKTFQTDQDRDDFRVFIERLARLTYENIETLPRNKTFGIPSSKYLDLLYELKWNFEPEMSSGAAVQMYIYETLTEFGICHSVNSLVARYNSYE